MKYIITLDTGTTNTRAILWDEQRKIISSRKAAVGVRNTSIDGNNIRLKETVRDCLEGLLEDAKITYGDIISIIASGMITSNVGLVEIPHCTAPAGINELASAVQAVKLPDVCSIPIHFIPGIKNNVPDVTVENVEQMDIMRGEEVEACPMIQKYLDGTPLLLVLPGSHMKFISVDSGGRMTGCLTSISGELLASITNDTILADAVGRRFVDDADYDFEMLLEGYNNSLKQGLGRACFSGRILNQFVTKNDRKIANYLLGAVLACDVQAIKNSKAIQTSANMKVVVGGKNPLRRAIRDLLKHDGYFSEILEFIPEGDIPLSAMGAYMIADCKKALENKEERK